MKSYKKLRYLISVFVIINLFALNSSCGSTAKYGNGVKEAEKVQEQQEKRAMKEYDIAVKEHRKHQSEYAKQLMKDMKKSQKENNKVRERSFWDRLFGRKCK